MEELRQIHVIRATKDLVQDNKIRVAAYCRVSTDSDDQVNSFMAQVRYYTDFINNNSDMRLVDVYADEGITGTSTLKRDEFNRMMKDSKNGKIDRVYVKSVSRFARNSLECIENIRLLKNYGTTVFFENDGIDTKTMNHELILYIKSAFAQAEALNCSKRVKRSNQMRMELWCSDELWVMGSNITDRMREEIEFCKQFKIAVRYISNKEIRELEEKCFYEKV